MGSHQAPIPYEEYWVAYVDILGYKGYVREADTLAKAAGRIAAMESALSETRLTVARLLPTHPSLPDYRVRVLSDTVVISVPGHRWGTHLLLPLTIIVSAMLTEAVGRPVRGAAVLGGHYDSGDVLFSHAVVEAHELEKKYAVYPRVLVVAEVVRDYRGYLQLLRENGTDLAPDYLWEDGEGQPFVNYLRFFSLETGLAIDGCNYRFLGAHRDMVAAGVTGHADDPRIRAKYDWLATYHNRFCQLNLSADEAAHYTVRGCEGGYCWLGPIQTGGV